MLLHRFRRAMPRVVSGGVILAAILGIAWACADTVAPRVAVPRGTPSVVHASLASAYGSGQAVVLRPAVAPDRCMDGADYRRDDGAMVIIGNCTGGENQRFTWDPDGRLRVYNTDVRCVSDQSGTAASNALIVTAPCDGRPGQRWAPTADGTGIQLVGTGRCIEVPAGYIHLALRDCHGGTSQQWGVPNTNLSGAYTSDQPVVLRPAVAGTCQRL